MLTESFIDKNKQLYLTPNNKEGIQTRMKKVERSLGCESPSPNADKNFYETARA